MNTRAKPLLAELTTISLESRSNEPKFKALYRELRQAILAGRFKSETRLPSTRSLALQLSVGRNTVLSAFDQLIAEGYLETRKGAGTYVASELPDHWISAKPLNKKSSVKKSEAIALSNYGKTLNKESIRSEYGNQSFAVGVPDLKAFPHKTWNQIATQISPTGLSGLMGYDDPKGYQPLREAIADYVSSSRAVNCSPDQVLVTCGAQQALDLCARLLLDTHDIAAMENPGYIGARRALTATGAKVELCPVDDHGINISPLKKLSNPPKLLYVTPAHQYPLGAMLPLERRLSLLEWATENNCWIIEDDYDSEYHYQNRPIASLQGLAGNDQVIYMGSFSKVLFPSLRLGYLILPPSLMPIFTCARQEHSGLIPIHSQAVTAEFMQQGHFGRHLRKMRVLYAEKLDCLLKACEQLKPWCTVHALGAGMHLALEFNSKMSESEVSKKLQQQGVLHSRLSHYYQGQSKKQGLVLGFANSSLNQINTGITDIRNVLNS
ncbi:hypothetical protein EOPP23_07075 [Endozoicomonas sp. OPT23]|uniref:MocR-like pyridoxine biosynthesis transcription factor PdxR n=1 Tax=Endozoicomonas sp. OPT23 TaxID=2072845 RepID=UPI00129A7808|nr:PLP-dependent aminotransferase family protein [Endozoicomonas sp. OPT23]MRI32748.1 hypothetical protein [Endozoicomonas sp. OPT23]